jgi:hypothetical protein
LRSTKSKSGIVRGGWRLFVGLGLLACLACQQPQDEQTGFGLDGERASGPFRGWAFTDDIEEIAIETRPWYGIPHSATIWCVEVNGRLYLGSYGWAEDREEERKFWEKNVARNPSATLGIDGKLFDVTVSALTNPVVERLVEAAYTTKYDMADVFGEDLPEWWYYAVELREP